MATTTMEVAGRDGHAVGLPGSRLDELRTGVDGPLLMAGDEGWDDACLIWNGMIRRVPALVARPGSARGVAHAVNFAREHGVLLGVKGGGHNIAGTSMAPGGLTLDMSRMTEVTVGINQPGVRAYGLGIVNTRGWWGHTGELPGYNSLTYYHPDLDAVMVVIVNKDDEGPAPRIADAMIDLVGEQDW